jgi:hypothetical protein
MADIFLVFIIFVVSSIVLFIAYNAGWGAGYREGKNEKYGPYYLVRNGWEMKLPGSEGSIKLVKDEEG